MCTCANSLYIIFIILLILKVKNLEATTIFIMENSVIYGGVDITALKMETVLIYQIWEVKTSKMQNHSIFPNM